MSTIRYLAYGSNLVPARLRARVGAIREIGSVTLTDWRLSFSKRGGDGSGKCTLERSAGALAYAAVYEIAVAAQATLDRIEGVGRGYRGEWLETAAFGPCYVYLAMADHVDPALLPFDWYHALVLAGADHHAFPRDYRALLAAQPHRVDPDRARAALNLSALDPLA